MEVRLDLGKVVRLRHSRPVLEEKLKSQKVIFKTHTTNLLFPKYRERINWQLLHDKKESLEENGVRIRTRINRPDRVDRSVGWSVGRPVGGEEYFD